VSPGGIVDVACVAVTVGFVLSGARTGAARMIVATAALIVGLYVSIIGRGPLVSALAPLVPGVSRVLIELLVLGGGTWIALGLAAWVLGRLLRGVVHAFGFGPADAVVGGLLGAAQAALLLSVLVFLADVAGSSDTPIAGALGSLCAAVRASAAADLLRGTIVATAGSLVAPYVPADLRGLLRP
jgi:uncharacterized membrane protein required for colicin V production